MKNIFQIGSKVTGESFIGRNKYTVYLRRVFLENTERTGKAIIGLTRIGKSSLVLNVFKNIPGNILYIYEDLNEWSEYIELWQDICYSIEDYLVRTSKMTITISENINNLSQKDISWIKLNRTVKKIFEELAVLKVKTILVLDEFDNATTLFSAGTKHFELFRTIFSDGKYDVSALTISRRNLYSIEGSIYQSSTFHGVLDTIHFKGFDDDDMEEYYLIFKKLGIILSDEQKDEIEYYAGRAPFLLSILGHYILETAEKEENIDITEIFLNKCKAINDYYRDCIKHLKRDDDLKRIVPFVIGPNVGVTQKDRDELINLGYLREEEGSLVAISSYFVNFLSANMLQVSIWDNIISLEKKIKLIIENEFARIVDHFKVGGENYASVQRGVLDRVEGISSGDIARYDNFISNNAKVFNIQSTYLDVISLNDSFKIIKACWTDIFAKYFGESLFSNWSFKFDKCARARNPIAHGHEEYLTDLDKNEIDTYCKQIIETIAMTDIKNIIPSTVEMVMATAEKYPTPSSVTLEIDYEAPVKELLGAKVNFKVLERGGVKRNNLKGVVEGKYRGIIPKNYLCELNSLDLDAFIGKELIVSIESINGEFYHLKYSR